MTKILVTGGAGYIGSHTSKLLAKKQHQQMVFDSLERGHKSAVRWGTLVEASLLDKKALDAVMAAFKPDVVVHFAAYALVGESVTSPHLYYHNNVLGTLNLLESMRTYGVKNLVFSSTCAVYGTPIREGRLNEEHPFNPINPYGATKAMMEQAMRDYGAYGIRSVCLRYFNAAGADDDADIGECHEPETHALPLMINAALGKGSFKVFGDDYPTPDGTAIRDYIHVSDIADAHLKAIEYLMAGGQSAAVNLGTGTGTSVMQLLKAVEEVAGQKVPYELAPRRAGDPPVLVADPGLADIILGWRAKRTNLTDIVRSAWKWHSK